MQQGRRASWTVGSNKCAQLSTLCAAEFEQSPPGKAAPHGSTEFHGHHSVKLKNTVIKGSLPAQEKKSSPQIFLCKVWLTGKLIYI